MLELLCAAAEPDRSRCPLCHSNILETEESWRVHLMSKDGSTGCAQNPRRIRLLQQQNKSGNGTGWKCDSAVKVMKCDSAVKMRKCDSAVKVWKCDGAVKVWKCDSAVKVWKCFCGLQVWKYDIAIEV